MIMLKKPLFCAVFLFLSTCVSYAQNSCLSTMDQSIGTLYLCGIGGQFKVLSLDRCNLIDSDLPAVTAYLQAHPRINALDLGENHLGDSGMVEVAKNSTIAWLNVSYNNIGDAGAKSLAGMKNL